MLALSRGISALLRWGLALLALLLVLAAIYVSVGRVLSPMVADYRDEVATKATELLHMPVTIGRLEGGWHGFAPELIAHDLVLGEAGDALKLSRVSLIPDLLQSLVRRQPRIAHLVVEGLRLSAQQDTEGKWSVAGLPQPKASAPVDMQQVLQQLKSLEQVSLHDSQVTVEANAQPPVTLKAINLTLRRTLQGQRLDMRLHLPNGKPLELQVNADLNAQEWQASSLDVYLKVAPGDWADWIPPSYIGAWHLQQAQLGGEAWLSWRDGGVERAVTRMVVANLQVALAEQEPVALQDIKLNSYFAANEQGFTLRMADLGLRIGEERWGKVQLGITRKVAEDTWQLSADQFDVTPLVPLVTALAPLSENGRKIIETLQPHGKLNNLQLAFNPQAELARRLSFSANLDKVGFSAFEASPSVQNISGSVEGDIGHGVVHVDAEEFSLHLATLFPKPWVYTKVNGQFDWTWDEAGVTLRSPYLQAIGPEGKAGADFIIRLLADPEAEDYMDLRVGIREGDASYTSKYLPTRVPSFSPQLGKWLTDSIKGGAVSQGFFQYQGSINHGSPPTAHNISLFFDVDDAELDYQPGWPALSKAKAQVRVEDTGVRIDVAKGQILNSTVTDATANIALGVPGGDTHLLIDGKLASNVGDAMQILQDSPLPTAETFAGWKGQGALEGALKLDLPLQDMSKVVVQVDFSSKDSSLTIASPKLELSKIKGDFNFDSRKGLSADGLSARALGHTVTGKAVAGTPDGASNTLFDLKGKVALETLTQWLAFTQPIPANGVIPYRLRINLGAQDSYLQVNSDLQGLAIDLPEPLGKPAASSSDAEFKMSLGTVLATYTVQYADRASLAYTAGAENFLDGGGRLVLGAGRAQPGRNKGLNISGRIAELDVDVWQAAIKPYQNAPVGDAKQLLNEARLRIDHFKGMGVEADNLNLDLKRTGAAWSVGLDSSLAKGQVKLPDSSSTPIVVNLDYLKLPAPKPTADGAPSPDVLGSIDPADVPPIDLNIKLVSLGERQLGSWSFNARPLANGVQFSNLALQLSGATMSGTVGWQGAAGSASSWYKGRLEGENLVDTLVAWGFAPSATSESYHLDVDGHWPGSPAGFALARFSGSMDASLKKGQFVEVKGSANALRIFGLLNFNSIGRRLRLDFSDLFGKGLSYDRVKGLLVATDGVYVTKEPLALKGPSSNVEVNGTLDLAREVIDAKLLVTLPVSNNLPLAVIIAGFNPAIGGALFVADKLLGDNIARLASVQYDIKGPLSDPEFTFDKPFEKQK
ncbi:YhdP family protein [Pseudomonas sp. MS19]|uniref:YhdP family protein n=1 Tax=Pseudomonas sp. MS19 TaxID=2579939 RepID=UPI001562C57B|nr:TIGR02099 family protein [Pseudomonas sp. MS19]